jgi:hypothetical protein
MLVNILGIIDDAKCYGIVRHLRWPDGVRCPRCDSDQVVNRVGMRPSRIGSATSAGPAAGVSMT